MSDDTRAPQPIATNPMLLAASFFHSAPVDLQGMADALGLSVNVSAKLPMDVSGSITRSASGKAGYHIDINAAHSLNRKRFTLAHEIAHYLLHRDLIGDGIEDNGLYRSRLVTLSKSRRINWQPKWSCLRRWFAKCIVSSNPWSDLPQLSRYPRKPCAFA